jgi:uncharacterized protein
MKTLFASLALVIVAAARSACAGQSGNPSFDCDKARAQDEHAICSDGHLGELDQAVSIAYRQVEQKLKDEARALARDSLTARHSCGEDRLCILDQQVNAITDFSNLGAEVRVPPWVGSYRVDLFKGRAEPPTKTLPIHIAECTITEFASISTRFGEELKPVPDDGTSVSFANGGFQVSYRYEPDDAKSHIGDEFLLCLVSVPKDCQPGD